MPPVVRRLILIAVACALGVALLALLTYGSARFSHYDVSLTAHLLAPRGSTAESISEIASDLGNPGPLLVVLLGLLAMAIAWQRPWHLMAAVGFFLLANVTTQLLKLILAHPRLQGALGVSFPIEITYPSGHTTAAFAAGAAIWLVAIPRWRGWAAVFGLAYGVATGIGVVVAGWHFVSDVAGAILVVAFWFAVTLAILVSARLERPVDWLPREPKGPAPPFRSGSGSWRS